jgi:hypothetical protein
VITIIYTRIEVLVYKNLEYISLLQSRAMLAEPSKMYRNQPVAVHPATIPRGIPPPMNKSGRAYTTKIK